MIYYTAWHDIRDVNDLYKEWTGKDINLSLSPCNSRLVVAKDDQKEDGKKIVGALQAVTICDQVWGRMWCLVENVYVKKEYRRQGIAKGLMKFVETQYFLPGLVKFIKLTSRKEAGKALYRSLGYEEGASFRKESRQ